MKREQPIRVVCVDDHDFMREGLESRIALEKDMQCVGSAIVADDLAEVVRDRGADVVLLDIEMPGADPFAAIEDLRQQCPGTRVIMLSAYVRDHYIDMAVDRGAWGYFSKGDPPDAVIDGIRRVHDGEPAFGRDVRARVELGDAGEPDVPPTPLHALTPRELEVLRLIGRGLSRAEIARLLHRSLKTIDSHHTAIMRKLDLHDRVEVALYAVREGLVEE